MNLQRVAWRGLWDRFAPPESLGAIYRALRKGFATRIRAGGPADLQEAARLFLDPVSNPQRVPVLVVFDNPTQLNPFLAPGHPPFFAHDSRERGSLLSFEQGCALDRPGLYLDLDSPIPAGDWPWIAVEAPDTRSLLEAPATPSRVEPLAAQHPQAHILHLLDLVELDCLSTQPRWEDSDAKRASAAENKPFPTETLRPLLAGLTGPGLVVGLEALPFPLPPTLSVPALEVDAFLQLTPRFGFERQPLLVTWGLRRSRFAPILFWEALHTLAPGGRWLDLDLESDCHGTPLCAADYPDRPYFAASLALHDDRVQGELRIRSWQKTTPSPLADQLEGGWSFGILTSGPSPQAARMAGQILALGKREVEVIICGPAPTGLPDDPRLRVIDLEKPEPRGWITRKKNLLARAARYPNLCLLHDRFEIPGDFFAAMHKWGPLFGILGLPNCYEADWEGKRAIRYADYQTLLVPGPGAAGENRIYNEDNVCNLDYNDYQGGPFICGGAYIAKRKLFLAVSQDESIFHCEWEDVTFGRDCLRYGIPHRINPFTRFVSATPHILGLTRLQFVDPLGSPKRGVPILDPDWAQEAARHPERFKPVLKESLEANIQRISQRWNALDLGSAARLRPDEITKLRGLSDFWEHLHRKVQEVKFQTSEQIAAVVHFAAATVYNWPNCNQQRWIAENETACALQLGAGIHPKRIGWGAGTMLATLADAARQDLAYMVDRDSSKWGQTLHGLEVHPPSRIASEAPDCLVVILCAHVAEIQKQLATLGAFASVAASLRYGGSRPFHPLDFMAAYFREVELSYPMAPPPTTDKRLPQ